MSVNDFQIQSEWNLAYDIHIYPLTQKVTILQNLLCSTVHAHALNSLQIELYGQLPKIAFTYTIC